jgi:hypothetical protein
MPLDHNSEILSVLDNPILTRDGAVVGWQDAGSVPLCEFPITKAHERVADAVKVFGYVDTMSRHKGTGIDTEPSHPSSDVADIMIEYHKAVADAIDCNWQRIQTTMLFEKIIENSANSSFHVDGVNVQRPNYTFQSAQKIVGLAAYPNPTEFLPRATTIYGSFIELFSNGNIRNHESIPVKPISHPGMIALFGYNESFHREPPPSPEQIGTPRLLLRSFITL